MWTITSFWVRVSLYLLSLSNWCLKLYIRYVWRSLGGGPEWAKNIPYVLRLSGPIFVCLGQLHRFGYPLVPCNVSFCWRIQSCRKEPTVGACLVNARQVILTTDTGQDGIPWGWCFSNPKLIQLLCFQAKVFLYFAGTFLHQTFFSDQPKKAWVWRIKPRKGCALDFRTKVFYEDWPLCPLELSSGMSVPFSEFLLITHLSQWTRHLGEGSCYCWWYMLADNATFLFPSGSLCLSCWW